MLSKQAAAERPLNPQCFSIPTAPSAQQTVGLASTRVHPHIRVNKEGATAKTDSSSSVFLASGCVSLRCLSSLSLLGF